MSYTVKKPKVGVLLFGNNGLRKSGSGTADGTYEERLERLAARMTEGLGGFAELAYPGIVYGKEDLARAMDAFYREKVDGVFAHYLSWAPDACWVRFLRDMPALPVLFASMTPEGIPFENTFSPNDNVAANTVRGLVGSLQASGSIARMGRPMLEVCLGTYEEILSRANVFFAAAGVRARLRSAVFAHVVRSHEVMWSTYVDGFSLFQHIGPELKVLANATIREEMERIPAADVDRAVDYLKGLYEVLPDVDPEKFAASVRASIATDRVAAGVGADMIVMNDLDAVMHRELGLRPGFLPCPFGHGIPATPEGDVGASTAAYILRLLSGRAANVVEPGYINTKTGLVDIGHGGPNDYTDPDSKIKIASDVRLANAPVKYPGAAFAWQVLTPGIKTMLHLSQTNGGFKMACTLVEALPAEHFHASFCHGRVRTLTGDAREVFGNLMRFGVTQHFAVTPGDFRREAECLAGMLGCEFLSV